MLDATRRTGRGGLKAPFMANMGWGCGAEEETPAGFLRGGGAGVYCEPLSFPAPGIAFTSPGATFSPEEVTP